MVSKGSPAFEPSVVVGALVGASSFSNTKQIPVNTTPSAQYRSYYVGCSRGCSRKRG